MNQNSNADESLMSTKRTDEFFEMKEQIEVMHKVGSNDVLTELLNSQVDEQGEWGPLNEN